MRRGARKARWWQCVLAGWLGLAGSLACHRQTSRELMFAMDESRRALNLAIFDRNLDRIQALGAEIVRGLDDACIAKRHDGARYRELLAAARQPAGALAAAADPVAARQAYERLSSACQACHDEFQNVKR